MQREMNSGNLKLKVRKEKGKTDEAEGEEDRASCE